jgi:hypothetical protein
MTPQIQGTAFFLQFVSDNRYKDLIKNLGDKWKVIKVAHEALEQIEDEVPDKRLQELISLRHQMDSEHFKAACNYSAPPCPRQRKAAFFHTATYQFKAAPV